MLTVLVCSVAGMLVIVSATNARGTDLRPSRNTDLVSLVHDQSRRNKALAEEVTTLRRQVDELTAAQDRGSERAPDVAAAAALAGLTAVTGPAVTVVLSDAPDTVAAEDVDADLLVVHQQDIQAVANALWHGGAEAMTIQGQRVISTTGIKCVGNTVVLHGIPYAPPYEISAIGNQDRMTAALADSDYLKVYQEYVAAFGLGYSLRREARVELPGYRGTVDLQYAEPV